MRIPSRRLKAKVRLYPGLEYAEQRNDDRTYRGEVPLFTLCVPLRACRVGTAVDSTI